VSVSSSSTDPKVVNGLEERGCCTLVPSLVSMANLRSLKMSQQDDRRGVHLTMTPRLCIRSVHWQHSGLVTPPDELIRVDRWMPVIQYLRTSAFTPVYELRIMLIGDGEVGKTSLRSALNAPGHVAARISKEERTVGIDISDLVFSSADEPTVKCQMCDFAGQEIYHLSHTLHFTRRCLYVLMWATHKFSEDNIPQALPIEAIVAPLKRWLQLLAAYVPEANVIVVGTHYDVDPSSFKLMQELVDSQLREEVQRLSFIADEEANATRKVLVRQQVKVDKLRHDVESQLRMQNVGGGGVKVPQQISDTKSMELFQKQIETITKLAPSAHLKPKRSLLQNVQSLVNASKEITETLLRLGRLHAVYDGSEPASSAPVAYLKFVDRRSFAVDSVTGFGVAKLLSAIESTCRDRRALPFMGELVPSSWLQVKMALEQQCVSDQFGSGVLPIQEAISKLSILLKSNIGIQVDLARNLDHRDLQRCLEFGSLLGWVFLNDGHFLREPRLIIELMKPLVHHQVTGRKFRQQFCSGSFDGMGDCLQKLHDHSFLDHRLMRCFKAWTGMLDSSFDSMMSFFKQGFMISDLKSSSAMCRGCSLVTARLCDYVNSDIQCQISEKAAAIQRISEYFAVYTLPSAHIGLIARTQAAVASLQPVPLDVTFGKDHICIERGSKFKCCVSMLRLEELFESKLGSLRHRLGESASDYYSHGLTIFSNDSGLFAFAARCIDNMIRACAFGSLHASWLPCRPRVHRELGQTWQPMKDDWACLNSEANSFCLSEIVSANASTVVLQTHSMMSKDILPRNSPIFISHAYSGDGTGECCRRIKTKLEERLLCSVWLDKCEMGCMDAFIHEMKRGVSNAGAFLICLTPLYLTRPNCLRELIWALDICSLDKSKKLCIIPMHPAVSYAGCMSILNLAYEGCAAQVVLPTDDRSQTFLPTQLCHLKGHKLSEVALSLLKRITGSENVSLNVEWLKLQPWLSDVEGEDWEEISRPWPKSCGQGKTVDMANLVTDLISYLKDVVLDVPSAACCSVFKDLDDVSLRSSPPSQDYLQPPDIAPLRDAFPHTLRMFSEEEAVRLMLMGLKDADVIGCTEHGLEKMSLKSASGFNPVDEVFRMAAEMAMPAALWANRNKRQRQ
jgi:GTPase SAR1 family protein